MTRSIRHDRRMTIETVYLVEDHHSDSMRYWAHVYLSAEKAKAGVEYWPDAVVSVAYDGKTAPSA
jgi:hypothetical protein